MSMAHNNSGGGSGCLTGIIVLIMLIGNAALFTGSAEKMPLLTILAVLGDIFVVGIIIKCISDKPSQNSNASSSNASSFQTAQDNQQSDVRSATSNTGTISAAWNYDNSKIGRLKGKYKVPNIPSVPSAADPLQKEMEPYQCLEVLKTANKVVALRRESIKKLTAIKQELEYILSCPGCSTHRERIKYLNNNDELLRQKKDEYMAELNAMENTRVSLLSKHTHPFDQLTEALEEVGKSQKIVSKNGVAFQSFLKIDSAIPGDMFSSVRSPVELNYGAYKFFLLPDAVLAFSKEDVFLTAFEPAALIISFQDQQKSVYVSNRGSNGWTYSDDVVGNDSVLISQGYTRTGWLHEKKNGGPDLRYSYNPMYQSRTDTYGYTGFSIQIGRYKAEYSISKGRMAAKLKPLVREYCSVMHELNTIPSLLRLLESAAKKKDCAKLLSKEYEEICDDIICRIGQEAVL